MIQTCKFITHIVYGAALLAAFSVSANHGRADTIVAAVSSSIVSIESNFTGSKIVLFGTVEPDAQSVSRPGEFDIVIVVRGPHETTTTWRKERFAGIWVNRTSRQYVQLPSYLAVMSSKPLEDVASPQTLKSLQLGLKNMIMLQSSGPAGIPDEGSGEFEHATIRLKQRSNLYVEEPYGVQFLSQTLFQAQIPIPANVRTGAYDARVFLVHAGAVLDQARVDIHVRKSGFEQFVYNLAHQTPLIYGLGSVLIAVFAGWFAGVVFRR